MSQPPRSKATSANSRQSPGARLWEKGWIYLPPGSSEQISPKDSRSSAIDVGHIIGKRLRSNLNSEQTPSKIKKTDIDRINKIYRPSFENGAEKLHESKNPNNAVNTKRERETVVSFGLYLIKSGLVRHALYANKTELNSPDRLSEERAGGENK